MDRIDSPVVNPAERGFYIPSLDGIRAISILIVFVAHAGYGNVIPGGFGVTVFFFLSGYLITTLLRREFDRTDTISIRSFYWRRFWRILPPMYLWLVVGVVAGLTGLTEPRPDALAVLGQAAHLTNYTQIAGIGPLAPGTSPMWSLAVEEHFYLGFPLLALWLLGRYQRRGRTVALAGICGATLVWRIVLVAVADPGPLRISTGTDTRIDAIVFGCLLAVAANPAIDAVPQFRPRTRNLAVAVCLGAILATFVIRSPVLRQTTHYTVQSAALLPLFFFAVAHHRAWLFRPLDWRWMRWLGVLSYSFYLIHFIVIFAIWTQFPATSRPVMVVVAGAISLALSWASHRYVELPARNARTRFTAGPATIG